MGERGGGSRSGCGARDGARPVVVVTLPTHRNPRSDSAPADAELKGADVLPEEIVVWEVLARLPAAAVLRCHAVCRSWRRLTSRADFLLAHHLRQPPLPLVVLQGGTLTDPRRAPGGPEPGRRLLGFDEHNEWARRGFELHGSCDGLLLLSLSDGGFSICNPATRQHAPLPALANAGSIVVEALYRHGPSGEHRVLYWNEGAHHLADHRAVCYVIAVPRGQKPRCIRVPAAFPGMKLDGIARNRKRSVNNSGPPVLFRGCLHWNPGRSPYAGIVVFDTVAESFRWMRCPAAAAAGYDTRLHDMGGSIGLTCFEDCRRVAKIWVLADYEGEVWSFKYKFPVESIYNIRHTEHLVLSHKGDMLVQADSGFCMFHCDSNGKLIQEFHLGRWGLKITGHRYKESLVKYDFFPRRSRRAGARVGQPHFFRWL